jgi:hypothetical protein
MEKEKAKEMGGRFAPSFHKSFVSEKLVVPTLDDGIYHRFVVIKN